MLSSGLFRLSFKTQLGSYAARLPPAAGLWHLSDTLFVETTTSPRARPYLFVTSHHSSTRASTASWSDEWQRAGLGAHKASAAEDVLNRLLFVQTGFGCDQHGDRVGVGATVAAVRACRNAIEFNSIPGVIEAVPGGRKNMLVRVKLGVPAEYNVDTNEVAKVFPYGKLLPIDIVDGGLTYGCGRVVPELGDNDDTAIIVCAAVSIGYHDPGDPNNTSHRSWNTRDGH